MNQGIGEKLVLEITDKEFGEITGRSMNVVLHENVGYLPNYTIRVTKVMPEGEIKYWKESIADGVIDIKSRMELTEREYYKRIKRSDVKSQIESIIWEDEDNEFIQIHDMQVGAVNARRVGKDKVRMIDLNGLDTREREKVLRFLKMWKVKYESTSLSMRRIGTDVILNDMYDFD
jgi:hypothetical protein